MKTTIKKLGISIICAVVLCNSLANAGSVAGFGGALEVTQDAQWAADITDRAVSYSKQIQQYATQVLQYQKQIQQYVNQFQSYKMMLQNIGKLPQAQWRQFQKQVLQLKKAVEFGQSVSYTSANFNQKFNNTFKGFDKYLQQAKGGNLDFTAEYKNMYKSTKDTVQGALQSLHLQESDLQSDESVMVALQNQSQSAVGQLSAVQAANQIALHQTTQLKKLQKTMMTQANMEATYMAKENDEKALIKAKNKAWRDNGDLTPNPSDDKNF